MPENSTKLLPVLVLNFGEISALQYCAGNLSGSDLGGVLQGERFAGGIRDVIFEKVWVRGDLDVLLAPEIGRLGRHGLVSAKR